MAELVGVRVEGAAQLRRTLRAAGVDMKKLTALNRAAAETVLPVARNTTPIGDPRNGHIKSTLRVGATQRSGIIRAGNKNLPYGGVLHWGNPHTGQQAQPWLAIAAKQTEPIWVNQYFDGLIEVLNSVKGA